MDLSKVMFVDLDKEYKLTTTLQYKPLKIDYDFLKSKISDSLEMKRINLQLKINDLSLKQQWKERFPLPKLSLTGLSYGYNMGNNSGGKTFAFTGRSANNIDLQLAINWTLPIWGGAGWFDTLSYKQAQAENRFQQYEIITARKNLEYDMFTAFHELQSQTKQISITKESLKSSASLLDVTLDEYRKGKADRESLKTVIDELSDTNELYLNYLLSYYLLKVAIAKRIDDDRLLGEVKISEEGMEQ